MAVYIERLKRDEQNTDGIREKLDAIWDDPYRYEVVGYYEDTNERALGSVSAQACCKRYNNNIKRNDIAIPSMPSIIAIHHHNKIIQTFIRHTIHRSHRQTLSQIEPGMPSILIMNHQIGSLRKVFTVCTYVCCLFTKDILHIQKHLGVFKKRESALCAQRVNESMSTYPNVSVNVVYNW